MTQNEINNSIHAQLMAVDLEVFRAILKQFTVDGECHLNPGNYGASDVLKDKKNALTGYYAPSYIGEDGETIVTVSAGEFRMGFQKYASIQVLANWERQMKVPAKQRAVFTVGAPEETTAITLSTSDNQAWTEKKMKIQRIRGDWWAASSEIRRGKVTAYYYNLNGVYFSPLTSEGWGRRICNDKKADAYALDNFAARILTALNGNWAKQSPYFTEVRRRANIGEFALPPLPVKALAAAVAEIPGLLAALQIIAHALEIEIIAEAGGLEFEEITATAPETVQISPESSEMANLSSEGADAVESLYSQPYNVAYHVARYGAVMNLCREYGAALESARCDREAYRHNYREGGRYRRAVTAHLERIFGLPSAAADVGSIAIKLAYSVYPGADDFRRCSPAPTVNAPPYW